MKRIFYFMNFYANIIFSIDMDLYEKLRIFDQFCEDDVRKRGDGQAYLHWTSLYEPINWPNVQCGLCSTYLLQLTDSLTHLVRN